MSGYRKEKPECKNKDYAEELCEHVNSAIEGTARLVDEGCKGVKRSVSDSSDVQNSVGDKRAPKLKT